MARKDGTGSQKKRVAEKMTPRRVILDVDTGHDDAAAIMIAASSPELQMEAITVTAGNQFLEKTLANTLNVCDALGIHTPVYAGMTRPLLRELVPAERIHGISGLDGPIFEPRKKKAEPEHAVVAIVRILMEAPTDTISIIAVGPLTNIAMAIRLEPAIADRLHEIIVMGGSMGRGNITPSAEFNVHADPEAAAIVFSSGAPVTMIGLDVTTRLVLDQNRLNALSSIGGKASEIFRLSMTNYLEACRRYLGEFPAMHDPSCVAYAVMPDLMTVEPYNVEIECRGDFTSGRTIVDVAGVTGRKKNTRVAAAVDESLFWPILERALRYWSVK